MPGADGTGSAAARAEVLDRIRRAIGAGQVPGSAGQPPEPANPVGGTAQPAGPAYHAGGTAQPAGPAYRAGGSAQPEGPPYPAAGYREQGERDLAGRLDLLAGRIGDYTAVVRRCAPPALAAAISETLVSRGLRRIAVPAGLDLELPADVVAVTDTGLSAAELDHCDGVITRAALAIAETGTLILDGSPGQGRRALTLVPDFHLCVVFADQVVELVTEAIALLQPERPLTLISGPSATSDIELNRVEGVHGPRTLVVIIVEPPG